MTTFYNTQYFSSNGTQTILDFVMSMGQTNADRVAQAGQYLQYVLYKDKQRGVTWVDIGGNGYNIDSAISEFQTAIALLKGSIPNLQVAVTDTGYVEVYNTQTGSNVSYAGEPVVTLSKGQEIANRISSVSHDEWQQTIVGWRGLLGIENRGHVLESYLPNAPCFIWAIGLLNGSNKVPDHLYKGKRLETSAAAGRLVLLDDEATYNGQSDDWLNYLIANVKTEMGRLQNELPARINNAAAAMYPYGYDQVAEFIVAFPASIPNWIADYRWENLYSIYYAISLYHSLLAIGPGIADAVELGAETELERRAQAREDAERLELENEALQSRAAWSKKFVDAENAIRNAFAGALASIGASVAVRKQAILERSQFQLDSLVSGINESIAFEESRASQFLLDSESGFLISLSDIVSAIKRMKSEHVSKIRNYEAMRFVLLDEARNIDRVGADKTRTLDALSTLRDLVAKDELKTGAPVQSYVMPNSFSQDEQDAMLGEYGKGLGFLETAAGIATLVATATTSGLSVYSTIENMGLREEEFELNAELARQKADLEAALINAQVQMYQAQTDGLAAQQQITLQTLQSGADISSARAELERARVEREKEILARDRQLDDEIVSLQTADFTLQTQEIKRDIARVEADLPSSVRTIQGSDAMSTNSKIGLGLGALLVAGVLFRKQEK